MNEIVISFASALATAFVGTLVAWLLARVSSGRLARTLDQATKIIEFIEHYPVISNGLAKISEANRNDVEKLMLEVMQAVRADFASERAVLPEFRKATSSVRSALLLDLPHRTITWLPYFLFHTLLLFMLYVFVVRVVQGHWGVEDTVVLLIAGVCAALVRLAVRQRNL